jgi:hypothetical protein
MISIKFSHSNNFAFFFNIIKKINQLVPLLPSFSNYFAFIFLKSFWNSQNLAKMKYICKKSSFTNHQIKKCQMFAISLSSCSRYNANFKFDQSVSAIHDSPPYFWDQWGWPPTETSLVTHARDHWWTLVNALDFAIMLSFPTGWTFDAA